MKLSQLLNIEKYYIENNCESICLYFLGGEEITYKPNISTVDNKYLGLEVVETSKIGKDYLIGLEVYSTFQGGLGEPFYLVRDLIEKVSSFVIFQYWEYKSYFDKGHQENEIFKGSIEDIFLFHEEDLKSFLDSPIGLVELATMSDNESDYLIIGVKRIVE